MSGRQVPPAVFWNRSPAGLSSFRSARGEQASARSLYPGTERGGPEELEIQVDHVCKLISRGEMDPAQHFPALPGVQFALETALRDMETGGKRLLFPSDFTEGEAGIPTNGLIWMGSRPFMISQIREKMKLGFRVLKLKVGALDFSEELELLKWIRSEFGTAGPGDPSGCQRGMDTG